MSALFKKKSKEELSDLEERQKKLLSQEQKIDKEYQSKVFIVRHKRTIFITTIFVILGTLLILGIYGAYLFISSFFPEEAVVEEVIEEKPPVDFKITSSDTVLLKDTTRGTYDVFTRLTNNNPEWGVSALDYSFILIDSAGNEVGRKEGKTYILPKSKRSLIAVNVEASAAVNSLEIQLKPDKVQKLTSVPTIDLEVLSPEYLQSGSKGKVRGDLLNSSPFSFEQVDLNLILYNKYQEVVGVNSTNVSSLLSGSRRNFTASWDSYDPSAVQVVVEPNVNVFKSDNFMKSYQGGQELEY